MRYKTIGELLDELPKGTTGVTFVLYCVKEGRNFLRSYDFTSDYGSWSFLCREKSYSFTTNSHSVPRDLRTKTLISMSPISDKSINVCLRIYHDSQNPPVVDTISLTN